MDNVSSKLIVAGDTVAMMEVSVLPLQAVLEEPGELALSVWDVWSPLYQTRDDPPRGE